MGILKTLYYLFFAIKFDIIDAIKGYKEYKKNCKIIQSFNKDNIDEIQKAYMRAIRKGTTTSEELSNIICFGVKEVKE